MKKAAILFSVMCLSTGVFAQSAENTDRGLLSQGTLTGDLMMNLNFFQRDTNIKASGNPLYDNYLSGSEAWLGLRYNVSGWTFSLRADAFNNSNLKNPTKANTDFGVGAWSITKEMKDLSITAGYIYDQIGSGLLFRAYEDRGLLIDNALVGVELKYKLTDNIMLKGFTGQQKNNNGVNNLRYGPVIRGFNAEGEFGTGQVHFVPGVGVLDRTLDQPSYDNTVSQIKAQYLIDSVNHPLFTPQYNMYAFCGYNTLTYKNFSWYIEGDYKTQEAINEPDVNTGASVLYNKPGNAAYTSISYGRKGIALNLNGKRTQDFVMRTSTKEVLLDGMLNRQPVIAVQRPERLIARYTPASQDVSEMAGSANLVVTPNDVTTFTFSYTNINTLDNQKLYREAFGEANYQGLDNWIFQLGTQYMEYNIVRYQIASSHSDHPIVFALTPFAEVTYRFSEKKSLRAELQYMSTKQDYGSWVFALLEYDIAPKWSLCVSDMYTTAVNKNADNPNYNDPGFGTKEANHYYNIFAAYTKGPHRFSLAYVKQVDGINCTGGVCRYEPAFSGVKATVTSSF